MEAALERWRLGKALEEGVEKQLVPPDKRRAMTVSARDTGLDAGAPIWLQAGKSRVVTLPRPVTRVSVGNPDLVGVVVLGSRTVMINAKPLEEKPGMQTQAQTGIAARAGYVSAKPLTPEPRIAETTIIFWSGNDQADSHSLVIADFIGEQVMLEVTVAELNRTSMEEHGIDFRQIATDFASAYFMGGGAAPAIPGIVTTSPPIGTPEFPLSLAADRPNFAFKLPNQDITAFIQLLQTEGMATILAQPKLVALSGQSAVFQVGGEIPIRIVTGLVADIEFKPFGTLVNFLPRISEDGDIMLTVTPEVSQPDFSTTVEGVPTFRTRRASTSARLRDGETLIIGGLIQSVRRENVRGVPYLQDIPGIGYIFRDSRHTEELTELMVVVTPRRIAPMPPDTTLALPTDRGPLTNEDIRTKPDPAETTRPRIPFLP
jgi:Flp pilus assembly secretin CpaC